MSVWLPFCPSPICYPAFCLSVRVSVCRCSCLHLIVSLLCVSMSARLSVCRPAWFVSLSSFICAVCVSVCRPSVVCIPVRFLLSCLFVYVYSTRGSAWESIPSATSCLTYPPAADIDLLAFFYSESSRLVSALAIWPCLSNSKWLHSFERLRVQYIYIYIYSFELYRFELYRFEPYSFELYSFELSSFELYSFELFI